AGDERLRAAENRLRDGTIRDDAARLLLCFRPRERDERLDGVARDAERDGPGERREHRDRRHAIEASRADRRMVGVSDSTTGTALVPTWCAPRLTCRRDGRMGSAILFELTVSKISV